MVTDNAGFKYFLSISGERYLWTAHDKNRSMPWPGSTSSHCAANGNPPKSHTSGLTADSFKFVLPIVRLSQADTTIGDDCLADDIHASRLTLPSLKPSPGQVNARIMYHQLMCATVTWVVLVWFNKRRAVSYRALAAGWNRTCMHVQCMGKFK